MMNRIFLIKLGAYLVLGLFGLVSILGFVASVQLSWIGQAGLEAPGSEPTWIYNGIRNEFFVWLSTAISGLVGGVAAAGFGQLTTKTSQDGGGAAGEGTRLLSDSEKKLRDRLTMIYATVFIVLGGLSLLFWGVAIFRGVWTPEVVRNLSGVWVGLLLPVLSQFFGVRSPTEEQLTPPGGGG
jgi:hypothetical protein